MTEPTIFAKASGRGRAAVALLRISGPLAAAALRGLCGRLPPPRVATLARLKEPASGDVLDHALVLWFPAPHSFTGEDTAELHLHGGRAVVDGVLQALARIEGLRPAEPGEFTRRAYRHGKMDLDEVEGLADLIEAETQAQKRQAFRQLDGALGRWAREVREQLIAALALAEACIDFADEEDLLIGFDTELRSRVAAVLASITTQLIAAGRGEKLREGLVVVIAGPPNVGKSTLLNVLAGRDVAIVSAFAGTTRDAIEVDLDLGGHAVRLIDTAGLRDTADPIESQGIVRARAKAASADLVLWLDDASSIAPDLPRAHEPLWTVMTKSDLQAESLRPADFVISSQTGAGIDRLMAALAGFAAHQLEGGETALVTRLRHRQALEAADRSLRQVMSGSIETSELLAEDLRLAIRSLATLVGDVDVEDILGDIFARFCIGK